MDINGQDVWHQSLNCTQARSPDLKVFDRYIYGQWFERLLNYIEALAYSDSSVFQHKETIHMNLEFEVFNTFLLKSFIFLPTPKYYLCFILYYFRRLFVINPLITNPIKWPNTLKQFVGNLPTNCLSLFGHFVNFTLKGLTLRSVRSKRFRKIE